MAAPTPRAIQVEGIASGFGIRAPQIATVQTIIVACAAARANTFLLIQPAIVGKRYLIHEFFIAVFDPLAAFAAVDGLVWLTDTARGAVGMLVSAAGPTTAIAAIPRGGGFYAGTNQDLAIGYRGGPAAQSICITLSYEIVD